MFENIFQNLLSGLPRIRTPIQLVGLLFSLFSGGLVFRANPDNIDSLAIIGAIGVSLIAIPLTFNKSLLAIIPSNQRVILLIIMLAMLLSSFGALAVVTARAVAFLPATGARFDSKLEKSEVGFYEKPDGSWRVKIPILFYPLTKQDNATVFMGLITLHDDDISGVRGQVDSGNSRCSDTPSCIGFYYDDLTNRPLFIRAGSSGSPMTFFIDIKRRPKRIKIWWEFFQKEGFDGSYCAQDTNKLYSLDGVPPVTLKKDEQSLRLACYVSRVEDIIL